MLYCVYMLGTIWSIDGKNGRARERKKTSQKNGTDMDVMKILVIVKDPFVKVKAGERSFVQIYSVEYHFDDNQPTNRLMKRLSLCTILEIQDFRRKRRTCFYYIFSALDFFCSISNGAK